jgi:uncharacterized FlaG/YvyC family protein
MSALAVAGVSAGIQAASSLGSAYMANRFTEKMMKNKYQWQVKDMRKAGLNPILAATQGAPIGASQMAQMPDLGRMANSAMQTDINQQQTDANERKINQEVGTLASQQGLNESHTQVAQESVKKIIAEIQQVKANTAFTESKNRTIEPTSEMINKAMKTVLGGFNMTYDAMNQTLWKIETVIQEYFEKSWYGLGELERKGIDQIHKMTGE